MRLTPLTSAAQVLLATSHDPYVRGSLRRPMVSGWTGQGAVAWFATDAEERLPYLMTHGGPTGVAELLGEQVTHRGIILDDENRDGVGRFRHEQLF